MKFFNRKDIIENNFELLKVSLDKPVNGLLAFLCTSKFLELLDLPLTKEQRLFVIYNFINKNLNLKKVYIAAKEHKISLEELQEVISLLNDEKFNYSIIELWIIILIYTDFKADKLFFKSFIKKRLIYEVNPKIIAQFINVQLAKNNMDVLYFAKKYYKIYPRNFINFPVKNEEIKRIAYEKYLIDDKSFYLNEICKIKVDSNYRIKLLKRFIEYLTDSHWLNLRTCFVLLKEVDKTEEVESAFIDIWIKAIMINLDTTYPEESMIKYKKNIDKLKSVKLLKELAE